MDDYSMEELLEYDKQSRNPANRIKAWGMRRNGYDWYIPYEKLKLSHLKNIVKWIKDHSYAYPQNVLTDLEEEYKRRYDAATPAEKVLYG